METEAFKDEQHAPCMKDYLLVLFLEMFGAAILMFGINFNTSAYPIGPALALFVAIIFTGALSGGHHNPAVTLSVYIAEGKWGKNLVTMFLLMLAQLVGAYIGMAISYLMIG